MKDQTMKTLFSTTETLNIFKLEEGQDNIESAATWNKLICQAQLQLDLNQYGELMLSLRSNQGQIITENQFMSEEIEKKIIKCKDTCRGYLFEIMSPDGSLQAKIGLLFETRIESFEFLTALKSQTNSSSY